MFPLCVRSTEGKDGDNVQDDPGDTEEKESGVFWVVHRFTFS